MNVYPQSLRLLSLDIASVTGFATLLEGDIKSGSRDFRRGKLVHPGAPHAFFSNWIRETLGENTFDLVIYEDAGFFKSADAVQVCVGMRGCLLAEAAKRGIPVASYAPSSVKLFWAGSGRADKFAMMAATRKRLPGVDFADNNAADAIALMHLHLSKVGIESLELLAT